MEVEDKVYWALGIIGGLQDIESMHFPSRLLPLTTRDVKVSKPFQICTRIGIKIIMQSDF